MKIYHISNNGKQEGPFTLDELKMQELKATTLVWVKGQKDWVLAGEVEELKDLIPPPLPGKTPKYDETYTKETLLTTVGAILLGLHIIFFALYPPWRVDYFNISFTNTNEGLAYMFLGLIIITIHVVIVGWVIRVASRQNRNETLWGIFALLLPAIALIVTGLNKKLYLPEEKGIKPILRRKRQAIRTN